MSDATASGHDDGHGHAHGHGHGHGHDHEHGRIARWLGGLHGRVTRREGSRLNRAQVIGLRVAAIAIRTVAFVMCPGDDIAAAVLPVAHAWTGDSDRGHEEQPAVLPEQPRMTVRFKLERDGGEPGPDPDVPSDLPVPPSDPAGYDVGTLYQRFVLEGVAAPGSLPSADQVTLPDTTTGTAHPDRTTHPGRSAESGR